MSNLLIKNARVLQITKTTVNTLEAQDILVNDNRIEAIQATGVDESHFDTVVDARGMLPACSAARGNSIIVPTV